MFHEKHSRTIIKSITWRVIAFLSSVIVLYIIIGDLKTSINHSLIIHLVKTVLYYIHERTWNLSNLGLEFKNKTTS